MDDKRIHYRVELPVGRVSANVRLRTGEELLGDVMDLSAGGAGIAIRANQSARLTSGDAVSVELWGPTAFGSGVRFDGVVRRVSELSADHAWLIGVQFDELPSGTLPEANVLLNRRSSLRVQPSSRLLAGIQARFSESRHERTMAPVIDLSVDGFAVRMEPHQGRMLSGAGQLDVSLRLPGSEARVELAAVRVYALPSEGAERWGLRFAASDEASQAAAKAEIWQYVVRRILEGIRPRRLSLEQQQV